MTTSPAFAIEAAKMLDTDTKFESIVTMAGSSAVPSWMINVESEEDTFETAWNMVSDRQQESSVEETNLSICSGDTHDSRKLVHVVENFLHKC